MKAEHGILILIIVLLVANFSLWLSVRGVQAKWLNVPPVPSSETVAGSGLGDEQFAYRNISLTLQNLGDTGGRITPLKNYDYNRLGKWFVLADHMDPQSNFIPFLAAYYFGGVDGEPDKLPPIIDYLELAGNRAENEKWRWLAQAIYLARFKMNDLDRALELANKLSALATLNNVDMPAWAKNMNVLVLSAKGDKEAAYEILMQTLQTNGDDLNPYETIFIVDQICNVLLDEMQAKAHPLCQDLPF